MTGAVQAYLSAPHQRDRESVRARIIAAAKRLHDRIGTTGFTLSAVATEAELGRATVYGHFSSRKQLLAQLSREQLAAEPQSDEPPADEPKQDEVAAEESPQSSAEGATNESAAIQAEVEAASSERPVEETPRVELAGGTQSKAEENSPVERAAEEAVSPAAEPAGEPVTEKPAETCSEPAEAAPVAADGETQPEVSADSDYAAFMQAQAEALDHLAKRVIVPKSMQREGTDSVLTRLEARVSVSEQTHAALEKSIGEKLKVITAEASALAASLEETKSRLEKFEERQQAAIAELRLDIHNLGRPAMPAPASEPPQAALPEPMALPPLQESAPVEPENVPSRVQPYLSSARAAAIQAAKTSEKPRRAPNWLRTLKRWRWPLIGAAAFFVAGFDVYVFVHYQPAQAAVVRPLRAVATTRAAHRVLTPQDELVRGLRYLNGAGVPTNVEKAARWLERAAENGNPVAQSYMGVLYQTGTGLRQNMATAVHWYEAAARAGNLKAMTNLGKAYAGGWEDGTDFEKAAEWFGRAAGFGDADAQFDLAVLYERGAGVKRSVADAYKWYMIAGAHGDANAAERASVLAGGLSPNEQLAAQAAAALYRPAKVDSAANDIPR